jgi:chemotaxis protein MotB
MSKKKHLEHVNHERWLVSYADFITLLFAFFVVLFASSQSDKKKQTQLAAAMQSAFTPLGTFDAHSITPPLDPNPGSPSISTPAPIQPPLPTAEQLSAQLAAQKFAETEGHIEKMLVEKTTGTRPPPAASSCTSPRKASSSLSTKPASSPLVQPKSARTPSLSSQN